jgi:CheY-like chemotaxis protein
MKDVSFLTANGCDINSSLELFGDIKTYNDTIGEFLLGLNEKLPKIKEYKDNKDMANYAIYTHSLKSDAKYFGFTHLAELALNHELKSKANDYYYVSQNYDELMTEANRVLHVVKQYLGQEEAPASGTTNFVSSTTVVSDQGMTTLERYTEKTILVADDSNIVRNFVERIFKDIYKVGTAKDGKEAIDIIAANKNNDNIVAILLDLNMPNIDGFAVLDYMTKEELLTKMPVSIISGDSSKETITKAFTYQIVDMLGKPFTQDDVKNIINKTIAFKDLNN